MSIPAFIDPEVVEEGLILDLRDFLHSMLERTTRETGRLVIYDQDHT